MPPFTFWQQHAACFCPHISWSGLRFFTQIFLLGQDWLVFMALTPEGHLHFAKLYYLWPNPPFQFMFVGPAGAIARSRTIILFGRAISGQAAGSNPRMLHRDIADDSTYALENAAHTAIWGSLDSSLFSLGDRNVPTLSALSALPFLRTCSETIAGISNPPAGLPGRATRGRYFSFLHSIKNLTHLPPRDLHTDRRPVSAVHLRADEKLESGSLDRRAFISGLYCPRRGWGSACQGP